MKHNGLILRKYTGFINVYLLKLLYTMLDPIIFLILILKGLYFNM